MKKHYLISILLILAVFISSCQSTQPSVKEALKGTLLLKITDHAVEDYNKVFVTISSIEVHKDGNWTTFSSEVKTFDLIQLEDVADVLGEKQLDTGHYTQIRLVVSESSVELKNLTKADVKVPSEKIKLIHEFDILEGQITELILDFDPSSVKKSGNQYIMTPAIKILTPEQFNEKVELSKKEKTKPLPPNGPTVREDQGVNFKEFSVVADDYSLNPKIITVNKDDLVKITFDVSKTNVYYGGLDFRSQYFNTQKVLPGSSAQVQFTATESFTYTSYWPSSGVKKADGEIIVKQI